MNFQKDREMFNKANASLSTIMEQGHNLTNHQLKILLKIIYQVKELRRTFTDK